MDWLVQIRMREEVYVKTFFVEQVLQLIRGLISPLSAEIFKNTWNQPYR
jgi:hypothetical protein